MQKPARVRLQKPARSKGEVLNLTISPLLTCGLAAKLLAGKQ